jgi:hypothetical protein
VADDGELIPLTLADWDTDKAGTICLVIQGIGHLQPRDQQDGRR